MFRLGSTFMKLTKSIASFSRNFQVAVIGASRPSGQSLSLLLKDHPCLSRLTLYDVPEETCGIAMDVSHIPRGSRVEGYSGRMEFALRGADVVVVTGGETRTSGQTDLALFRTNVPFVISAMQEVVAHCPTAFIVIATEPINFTMPLACKALESGDAFDRSKVLGVTSVDTMRAQTCVGRLYHLPPEKVRVPVICGHSSATTIPLLSHVLPAFDVDNYTAARITECVRGAEDHVSQLKWGCEGPTLSSAFATYCTVSAILNALNGHPTEHVAFVANNDYGTKYFASPVIITKGGISGLMQFQVITSQEAEYIYYSTGALAEDIRTGESYFNAWNCPRYAKANVHMKFYY